MNSYSIADALRFTSGAQVRDYGGIGGLKTIDIRSIGNTHTGVSYGGIEISESQNGIVDLGRFSLQNVGSITVRKGTSGEILRPASDYASASGVSIVPLRPEFRGKGYNLRASLESGSFGTFSPELTWEQRLGAKTAMQLNAAFLTSDGRYRFRYLREGGYDTTATRKNGDIRAVRAEPALYFRYGGWIGDGRIYFYSSERGLPGAVVRGHLSHCDRQRDLSTFAQVTARRSAGKSATLLGFKLHYDYLHYLWDQKKEGGALYVNNHYHRSGIYLSLGESYRPLPSLSTAVSADYSLDILNADLRDFARPLRHTARCVVAAKWEAGNLTLSGSALINNICNHSRLYHSTKTHTDLSPSLSASWRLPVMQVVTARAFFKRSCRYPTFNDLYYSFIGNTQLRPEYATQYDAGLTWSPEMRSAVLRVVKVSADIYINRVSDKIIAVPAANQFRWTMVNVGKALIRGADFQGEAAVNIGRAKLTSVATLSLCRAEDRTYPESPYYRDQLPYMPRRSASLAFTLRLRGWTAQMSAQTNSGRYDSSASTPQSRMPAYTLLDIAAGKEMKLRECRLRLSAALNNVTGRHYEVVRCYPMPGRNCKFTLTFIL